MVLCLSYINFAEFNRNKENHLKSVEIRWFERVNN